jgi:hypothetical protein
MATQNLPEDGGGEDQGGENQRRNVVAIVARKSATELRATA